MNINSVFIKLLTAVMLFLLNIYLAITSHDLLYENFFTAMAIIFGLLACGLLQVDAPEKNTR
jgi:hypothetical protein